jgi:mannosylglycerate hydrolase
MAGRKKAADDKKKEIGLVVPQTHWDREWRYPLWRSRMSLMTFFDQLFGVLDSEPEYRCIVLDGQTVMVEDYLEARPEKTAQLKAYVKQGRIKVGPWYTLPDLFPVDGESLVRNLLRGFRHAEELGGVMKVAYTSFGWGQTAQFPQIFAGFGIDFVICGKSVSDERAPEIEFLWESPDGTRLLTSRLGEARRANFFMNAYIPVRFGMPYLSDEFRFAWGKSGVAFRRCDSGADEGDYDKIADVKSYFPNQVVPAVRAAWKAMDATRLKEVRLLMDGSDASGPQLCLTRLIKDANKRLDDIRLVHGTLEEYAAELKRHLDLRKLRVVKGELRDGAAYDTSGNALATRIPIKQLNRKAENILLGMAEPLSAIRAMGGADYPAALLAIAWRNILQSQSHDSINGVTQDRTVSYTLNRLDQACEIGEALSERHIAELAKGIDLSRFGEGDVLLLAYNPHPRPVSGVVKACIDMPQDQCAWDIAVKDGRGNALAVQHLSREEKIVPVDDIESRPWPFHVDRHAVCMESGEIPAGGYTILQASPDRTFKRNTRFWVQTRKSAGDEISRAPGQLENESLSVRINPNGSLDLHDKVTGASFASLHYFEDTGDAGDYWVHYPPYENRTYNSLGCAAEVWLEENGPLSATLGVRLAMRLPTHASFVGAGIRGPSRRSDEMAEVAITSRFTLQRGSPLLQVKTQVCNTVEDHRMRLMFPTRIKADWSAAAGHFGVDQRPVSPRLDGDGRFYPDMQTHPQQGFVDLSDGARGFAVVNRSFTEYEAAPGEEGMLAITLFRSVRNVICAEFRSAGEFPQQKGGQLLQTLDYEYALYPHAGDWVSGLVAEQAARFNRPPAVYQLSAHRLGKEPIERSLYALEPANLMLSCFKKAEDRDSFIARVYNPTGAALKGSLTLACPVKKAYLCSLNEVRDQEVRVADKRRITLDVAPCKIVTLEVVP